jgi:hypothetical protein
LGCDLRGCFIRGLKVMSALDQLDTERPHCRVLFDAIAVWDDYGGRNSVVPRREANGLPVIATCCGNYSGRPSGSTQVVEVDETTANLE